MKNNAGKFEFDSSNFNDFDTQEEVDALMKTRDVKYMRLAIKIREAKTSAAKAKARAALQKHWVMDQRLAAKAKKADLDWD